MNIDVPVHPAFPIGWQTDRDFVESFLIIAALELRARLQIDPANPFGEGVFERLPPTFKTDTFVGLLAQDERIGRFPLLELVWRFADEKIADFRKQGLTPSTDFWRAISQMTGVTLGAHGTSLFMAAFERRWFFGIESDLTPTESAFIAGDPIFGSNGNGVLVASGPLFLDSIWLTSFRLTERRGPEHYLLEYQHRIAPVLDILERGAQRAPTVVLRFDIWPGWAAQ